METAVTLNSICQPSEDVVAREIEGELIIVPLVAGIGDADDELYTLNETGQAIWQALDGRKSLGQVAQTLATAFSSEPKEIENDVLGFAIEMVSRRLLAVRQ
jgi:hypothetical protein